MENPFDKIANGYSAAQGEASKKPKACPHCGHTDDVPDPDQKSASAFVKGMGEQPDYLDNIKKGLGLGT
jgi:hypothetical protein